MIGEYGVRMMEPIRWRDQIGLRRKGEQVLVTVERHHDRRSSQQNRRYWGAIVPTVGWHFSKDRPVPLHSSQVHHVLKSAFLGVDETPLGPVPKSTRDLTTAEFSAYCDAIEAHAASEWGLHIPAPGEA